MLGTLAVEFGVCVCARVCKAQARSLIIPVSKCLSQSVESILGSVSYSAVVLWRSDIPSHDVGDDQFTAHPWLKHEELDIFGHKSDEE